MLTGLLTEWIRDSKRFAGVASAWDALAEREESPFGRHGWLAAWWAAFGHGKPLQTCVLWDGGDMAAAFPLWGGGQRLAAMANDHTPIFRPLARGPVELRALVSAVLSRAIQLELPAVPAQGSELRQLADASRQARWALLVERQRASPFSHTDGDFACYRRERKVPWREIERRARKLEREHEVVRRLVEPPVDLDAELDEGLRLEASGWKGLAGTAILSSPQTAAFYRSMARDAHARGELRLSRLRADGRLVAFDLALLRRGRYFLLKTTFDETLRSLAPGMTLRRDVIERCFELGLCSHEFLGDADEWKALFSTGQRELCRYRGFSRQPAPAIRYSYARWVRPRLKRAYRAVTFKS